MIPLSFDPWAFAQNEAIGCSWSFRLRRQMSSMLPGEGRVVKRCEAAKRNGSEGNEHRTTLGESRNSASESEGDVESTSWRHSKSRMPQQTCICNICMHFLLLFFSMFWCIFHFHFPLVFQFPAPWHARTFRQELSRSAKLTWRKGGSASGKTSFFAKFENHKKSKNNTFKWFKWFKYKF